MILSHARLPIPTLPQIRNTSSDAEKVNQVNQKLTKRLTTDILSAFLASRRQGTSNHTLLFYQRCISKAIGIELSPQGVSSFLGGLKCGNGKLAYFRALRVLCIWLWKQGYISDNPIAKVDAPKTAKQILPSVTTEQKQILLECADNSRDRAIISLFFDSGLRLSELCSIRPEYMDWESNTLKVIVKGNREAKAAFTPHTARLLKDYISNNGHNQTLFGMRPRGVQDMLSRLNVATGIKCNAHSFRRGFACNLHKKGLSTLSIMHLGRWSSLDMVTRYTKSITFDDCLELYKKVNS